jgi:superfamily II DNA or RNA helicase
VVLATGLGKTWLAAFDSENFERVLFVAHREEILNQSMRTFRRIRPQATFGFYNGQEKTPDAGILFASIQTLSRTEHLEAFPPDHFDYLVIDEFHHAAAPTYQKVIDHFNPRFLLGLTATPERTDGGNLLALCSQNLVYRCDLAEGMEHDLLCPLHYYGVPDEVDYSNIPWRNSRFDPEELTTALATIKRAENCIDQYQKRAGQRTVAFCSTQRHADFMAGQFQDHGIHAVAVHSGPTTAPRTDSLKRLEDGEIQVICCVDMFNEGLDLPGVDTVMMLRPTESRIIWLQQLGRGLRKAGGKSHLTVIDYIGNHRTFRIKLETLVLELLKGKGRSDAELRKALREIQYEEIELPPGCEVTYDLQAVEILKSLLRSPGKDEALRAYYEEFSALNGVRPTAVEAYQDGLNPRAARQGFGSWLGFVQSMGGLTGDEEKIWRANLNWFEHLEKTPMVKSYKMVVLQAMLTAGRFPGEIENDELVRGVRKAVERSARLRQDVGPHLKTDETLLKMLQKNPIPVWCGGKGTGGTAYFEYDGGVVRSVGFEGDKETVAKLTREIVEWRVGDYLDRAVVEDEPGFRVKVNNNGTNPILFPLNRDKQPNIPTGEVEVIVEGEMYLFRFVKVAVNVAHRPGSKENVLPEILKRWFGENSGAGGTRQFVRFERDESSRWSLEKLERV